MKRAVFQTASISDITTPFGNTLPLTDALGRMAPDAFAIASAFMIFPNDPISAWAYLDALALQESSLDADGPGSGALVLKWCEAELRRKHRQMHVAAMVAAFLVAASMNGRDVSLRRAVAAVGQVINDTPELCKAKWPSEESNVRRAFDYYKPSIHLWLAMIGTPSAFASRDFERSFQQEFFSAAVIHQGILGSNGLLQGWRPWVVPPSLVLPGFELEIGELSEKALFAAVAYAPNPDRVPR